jgi:ureidoglycolate hydrolase
MQKKITTISKATFKEFGQVIEMPVNQEPTIEVETVKFWKQQAMFTIEGETEIGVLKINKQAMVFDQLENHFKTPTGLICLDGDCVIGVTSPADEVPKADDVNAFLVPQGQLFVLAEKCWHSATYPVDKDEITLLVIFQKDALDNDTVFEDIDQSCELVF